MMRDRRPPMEEADGYRAKALKRWGGRCERCDEEVDEGDVEVHHEDRNRGNDNDDNLEVLCHPCHMDEHHGDDPLPRLLLSMPDSIIDALDAVVEEKGYHSRSEAVARAILNHSGAGADAANSVSCWFADDRHTRHVSDRVVSDGGAERGK